MRNDLQVRVLITENGYNFYDISEERPNFVFEWGLSILCLANIIRKMSTEGVKGVPLESVVKFLEGFASKSLAEKWDNTGLLIEPYTKKNVNSILLTNDLTENVMQEALHINVNLIVSYHPPIFQPLKTINNSSWKERIVAACLENSIAVYSPHTSWDTVQGGVNDWLASVFECDTVVPIRKLENDESEGAGIGRYCKLRTEIPLITVVNNVKNLITRPHLQIALARCATLDTTVKDVAICAGSGSSVLKDFPAQLYLTGEMSHHDLLEAIHNGTSVIVCNHSNSERGFLTCFKKILDKQYESENIQVYISKADEDPLTFV